MNGGMDKFHGYINKRMDKKMEKQTDGQVYTINKQPERQAHEWIDRLHGKINR
jgi:hypothetical protein